MQVCRRLTQDDRRIFAARLDAAYRHGHITATGERVGLALLHMLGRDGRLDPSHATIAKHAGCSERTVRRALADLKALGLLTWRQRIVVRNGRAEQTSNAYCLVPDGAPVPRSLFNSKGLGSPARLAAASPPRSVEAQIAAALAMQREWEARRTRP